MTTEVKDTETKDEQEVNLLDTSIRKFFNICGEVQDAWSNKKKEQPYWSVCCNKFQGVYLGIDDVDGFTDVFTNFHEKYGEQYCVDIFKEEDDKVNDDFFMDRKVYPKPGEDPSLVAKKKKGKSSWNKRPTNKGRVIYFSNTDPKASGVCIAIGEIYCICTQLYEDMEKSGDDDSDIRALPPRLLNEFYKIILFANGENCKGSEIMKSNIKILEEIISDVTSDSAPKNDGGPFGILKDVVKKLTGGKNPVIPGGEKIGDMISNFGESDGAKSIKTVFTNVMGNIADGSKNADGEDAGIGGVLNGIAKGLQNPETTKCFEDIQGQIGELTNGALAPPKTEVVESNEGADEQE